LLHFYCWTSNKYNYKYLKNCKHLLQVERNPFAPSPPLDKLSHKSKDFFNKPNFVLEEEYNKQFNKNPSTQRLAEDDSTSFSTNLGTFNSEDLPSSLSLSTNSSHIHADHNRRPFKQTDNLLLNPKSYLTKNLKRKDIDMSSENSSSLPTTASSHNRMEGNMNRVQQLEMVAKKLNTQIQQNFIHTSSSSSSQGKKPKPIIQEDNSSSSSKHNEKSDLHNKYQQFDKIIQNQQNVFPGQSSYKNMMPTIGKAEISKTHSCKFIIIF